MGKNSIFPPQKLSLRKKTKEWRENSLEAIISRYYLNSTRRSDMKIAYDIMNSEFDETDLKYVTDPYKVGEGFPAKIQSINIVRPKIELLKGEETKRPDSFIVFRTDEAASDDIQQKQKDMIYQAIEESMLNSNIENDEQAMQYLQQRLKEIKNYISKEYYDPAEQVAVNSLKYLKEKLDLKDEFLKGWEDALIAGEEIYYTGIVNGEPIVERVNPLRCAFDRDPNLKYIDEGEWFVRHEWMTPSAVYDRFYDIMEEKDLDMLLDTINAGGQSNRVPSMGSDINTDYIVYKSVGNTSTDDFNNVYGNNSTKGAFISVYHGTWRSFKKIGYLSFTNPETGELEEDIVDESYKPQEGENIVWDWIIEWWEGYRVGNDIYIGISPIEYQSISIDNPNAQRGPYTGAVYNYNNSRKKSLVDIMKPLQYIYLVLWYRLELTIARDKGKILTMDITQIPKGMGIDEYKWMHYLTSMGVNFINPYDCFAPGTKVLMSDGTRKSIEEIEVGELVMGRDGTAREVLHTHNGLDHMYRLKSRTGSNDQIVNSTHKIYYKQKDYYKGIDKECLATPTDLMVEDLDTPYIKNLRYFERVENINEKWNSDLLLDPYILGLWLGDGSTGKVDITNIDPEITSYLKGYADANGMRLNVNKVKDYSDVLNLRLCNKDNIRRSDNKPNQFKEALKYYNVLNNKHIPKDFIYTNKDSRLALLAGLIDTDGYYSFRDNCYVFSQSEDRKHIVEDAAFIARSLGFKCTVNIYETVEEKWILDNNKISTCQPTYVLSILEGDYEIPTLIERKQARFKNKRGNKNQSNFKVEYEGIGEFYGISIDGDNLFLLDDFTIVHNSGWDIPGREGGKPSQFNQISALDLSMTNVIAEYIGLLEKVEDMVGELSGVSKARQGQIHQSSLVGNVEREVIQSSHITEPLFWRHSQVKKRVLTNLLDTARFAWRMHDKKKLNYIFEGPERVFINISEDFLNSDYDIFLTDATKEHQNIEALKTLYQPAMQNGASLLDIASIMTEDNMSEIKKKLTDIEQQRAEMMQAQQEAEQAMAQQQSQLQQEELRIKEEDSIRKADTAITVALIGANQEEGDVDVSEDNSLEVEKVNITKDKNKKDYEIKRKQLDETIRSNRVKESIAKSKPKTTSNNKK